MLSNNVPKNEGQLITLYLKWKESPEQYGKEMTETVDKIIYSTLSKQSLEPIYRKFEDREDLIQDLRILCFQKLNRVSNPDNKRIFNFLRISISLALKDKARKVGKRLDREPKEIEILGEKAKSFPSLFFYNDKMLEQVATLKANGETDQYIMDVLSISRTKLSKEIEKLRVIYSEKK